MASLSKFGRTALVSAALLLTVATGACSARRRKAQLILPEVDHCVSQSESMLPTLRSS